MIKNEFQDLEAYTSTINNAFARNPRRSISALYRRARSNPRLCLIGCYPILATIAHSALELGIKLSRKSVTYALNQSDELSTFPKRDKISLLDYLFNHSLIGLERASNATSSIGIIKEDLHSHQNKSDTPEVKKNGSHSK